MRVASNMFTWTLLEYSNPTTLYLDSASALSPHDGPAGSGDSPNELETVLPPDLASSSLAISEAPSHPDPMSVDDFIFEVGLHSTTVFGLLIHPSQLDAGIEPSLNHASSDDTLSMVAPPLLRQIFNQPTQHCQ